ncbi:hypothetical protein [Aquimarina sediminis]|uniref:hypothetical protein n=1 Tax=Aquimarina sediminis TaxID=2070536 RepID=UPI000CA0591D|nr:hypothetical protein [Aquimarina sediminis]
MIQLLTIFEGLFSVNEKEKKSENHVTQIFLTSTHTNSGRTLMIEEESHSVWAYLLRPDKEGIDFDGFICAVVDPLSSEIDPKEITKGKKDAPLPAMFANRYSYIKNLKKKDIKIHWENERVTVFIKKKVYLIMDLNTKVSYSRGLSKNCVYGKKLEE